MAKRKLGSCVAVETNGVSLGNNAGANHTSGTGGMFLGYSAGVNSVSGPMAIAIGANAALGSATGDAIAIGTSATVSCTSTASSSIALGRDSVCTSPNTIVLGSLVSDFEGGPVIEEFGLGHQYFWRVTTANTNLVLSGTTGVFALLGGWIEFIDITAARTLTLPSRADIMSMVPDQRTWMCGQLVVHNFNGGGFAVAVTVGTDSYWDADANIPANSSCWVYWRIDGDGYLEFFP